MLPVVIGINGMRHQISCVPKKRMTRERQEYVLEGPELVLQRFGCVLNLRCISVIISRML